MEPSAKKRRGGSEGEAGGRPPLKPRPDDEGVRRATTDDGEVEEFFSILRRMRDASRWLAARQRAGTTDVPARWSPEFTWEDFADHGDVREDAVKDATAAAAGVVAGEGHAAAEPTKAAETSAPRLLDLNADPVPEAEE